MCIFPDGRAEIVGLARRQDLNGKRGCVRQMARNGRVSLRLDDGGQTVNVRPRNLRFENAVAFADRSPQGTPWSETKTLFGRSRDDLLSAAEVVRMMYPVGEETVGNVDKVGVRCAVLSDLFINMRDVLNDSSVTDDYGPLPSALDVRVVDDEHYNRRGVLQRGGSVLLDDGGQLQGARDPLC